jgi:hypothetical protein
MMTPRSFTQMLSWGSKWQPEGHLDGSDWLAGGVGHGTSADAPLGDGLTGFEDGFGWQDEDAATRHQRIETKAMLRMTFSIER